MNDFTLIDHLHFDPKRAHELFQQAKIVGLSEQVTVLKEIKDLVENDKENYTLPYERVIERLKAISSDPEDQILIGHMISETTNLLLENTSMAVERIHSIEDAINHFETELAQAQEDLQL